MAVFPSKDKHATNWGRGRANAVRVNAPGRDPHTGEATLPAIKRRLSRLAETVNRTPFDETTVALDFRLFRPPRGYREADVQALEKERERGNRVGGGTSQSVAVVRTADESPVVTEFVVRLASPQRRPSATQSDARRTQLVEQLRDLVADVGPPVAGTEVWLRPTLVESQRMIFPPLKEREFLNRNHPHIGARGVAVHPATLLDFVSDLLAAYPDALSSE
jgi:hypothetical protein